MNFEISPIYSPGFKPTDHKNIWSKHRRLIIFSGPILILAVFGIFWLVSGKAFSESKVDFKLEAPSEASSGDLITYKLTYANNNQVEINNIKLSFFYPSDSVVIKDERVVNDLFKEVMDINNLSVGAGGETDLSSLIVGDRGNIKTARAILTFSYGGNKTVFKKEVSLATTITALSVPISLVAPPNVINNQKISYIIDYRNESSSDLDDLRLKIDYPESFAFSSASPSPDQGQNIWQIKTIKQAGGNRISISGNLSGKEGESKSVAASLQKKIDTPEGEVFVDFEKVETSSLVSSPLLSIKINANDSDNYTAHLNDNLKYSLFFKNNSNFSLTNLRLTAKLEGGMYDFSSLTSDGFFNGQNNTVFWDQSSLPVLASLGPNQSGSVSFQVRLKNSFGGVIGASNSLVKISASLQTDSVPATIDADRISADSQLVTKITASPSIAQKITINDGSLGLGGPFPPQVDKKTAYNVTWTVVNPSNSLNPAKVTAILSPGVNWENKVSLAGTTAQPSYNSKTNSITWDLSPLAGGVGLSQPKYELRFQISSTPSINLVGKPVPLLKNITLEATDISTKEKISLPIRDTDSLSVSDSNQVGNVQP